MSLNTDYNIDDDKIIEEIDVKINHTLDKHLFLFQYPNQSQSTPLNDNLKGYKVQVKPTFEKFQIKVPMDTTSETYNNEKGKELYEGTHDKPIGANLNDLSQNMSQDNESNLLTYQTLTSYQSPSQTSNFIAIMKDNVLHLNPIKSIVQLRPSFEVVDKIEEKRKNANKKKDSKDENEAKITSLYAKYQAPDDGRQEPIVETATKLKTEKWVDLKYFNESTHESASLYDKLISSNNHVVPLEQVDESYFSFLPGPR